MVEIDEDIQRRRTVVVDCPAGDAGRGAALYVTIQHMPVDHQ
jgi:hypothetical protein